MTFTDAWDAGLSPIPLRQRSKVPLMPWKRYQTERATRDQCLEWDRRFLDRTIGPTYNVGLVTGEVSNLVVVDADTPRQVSWCHIMLPKTVTVQTGRGVHFYYQANIPCTRNQRTTNFDVRGEGGYVVGPGSTHENGEIYTLMTPWQDTGSLPVFNEEWSSLICTKMSAC